MKTKVSVKLTLLATIVLLAVLAFSNLAQEKRQAQEQPPAGRPQSTKISQGMLKEISQNQKFRDASALAVDYGEAVDLQAGMVEREKQVAGNWQASFPVINASTKRPGALVKLIYQQNGGKEPEVYFDNGGQTPPANHTDNPSTARLCGSWSDWTVVNTRCVPVFHCFGQNQKGMVNILQKTRTCMKSTQHMNLAIFRSCGC